MKKSKIEVYLGAPFEVESERRFLSALCSYLDGARRDALILANFLLPPHNPVRQIDFLVILDRLVCHIELKCLTAPAVGGVNGQWYLRLPDGTKKYLDANPYVQALACKYAISDEMHLLAKRNSSLTQPTNRDKFFKHIESVVCVYPDLIEGSNVPSDKRVRVLGYQKLLDLLNTTTQHPGWTQSDWTTFAMDIGLVRQDEMAQAAPGSAKATELLVHSYCQRFREYNELTAARPVPVTLKFNGKTVDSNQQFDLFAEGRHCQIVGPPGSGKSLHARYMAVRALEAGRVPILAHASEYENKLTNLLNRSIAHFCPQTATVFIDAVRQLDKPLTLIIDGINECPNHLKNNLIWDLQAAFLRWEIPIVLTSQEIVSLPNGLSGDILQFNELNDNERKSILQAYAQQELPANIDDLSKPFRSAYELSLMAACLSDIDSVPTRARLFDAYLRLRCRGLVDPALASRFLSEIANSMQSDMRSNLPVDHVWRLGERVVKNQQVPLKTISDVISCGLVDVRQGQCAFRHELLQRYFESISLVRNAEELSELYEELKRPVNHSLIELALGMQTVEAGVRACLKAAADAGATSAGKLFAACINGDFGTVARNLVIGDGENLLRQAELDLMRLKVDAAQHESIDARFIVELTGEKEWTEYEMALVNAVANALRFGLFLEDVLNLVAVTEEYCLNQLAEKVGSETVNKRSFRSNLFWELFVMGTACRKLPAAAIIRAIDRSFLKAEPEVVERIQQRVGQLDDVSPAQLYLLLSFLRYVAMPKEQDVGAVMHHCWRSGVYHLQFKMLDCVHSWQRELMSEATRTRIGETLTTFQTSNVMLSTQLVDTLMAYDLIEPPVESDEVNREIAEIISRPNDPDSQQMAYGAVSNTFEEYLSPSYFPAIESLSPSDRTTLYIMAALAVPPYSFTGTYVLSELLKVDDPRTVIAFERFVRQFEEEAFCPQDSDGCFVLGHIGCAKFLEMPAHLSDLSTENRRACQLLGEIIFWLSKPTLSAKEVCDRCTPIWTVIKSSLAFEAVDALRRLVHASCNITKEPADNAIQRMFSLFRAEIRFLLEFGMKHREHLSAIDKRFQANIARELTTFMIHTLGQIGTSDSVQVISPLIEHRYHGQDAVEAIRQLNSSRIADRITVYHRYP